MSVSKIIEPFGCDKFGEIYPNKTAHKRTIFLDLDDTLIYVSILKLERNNLTYHQIEHEDSSGKIMKVNFTRI